MMRPNRPAPAKATLVSGAEFPVAVDEAPDDVPIAVRDADEPVPVVEALAPVPVADAPDPVAAAAPAVEVKKYEETQLDWQAAYASVSAWVPFP